MPKRPFKVFKHNVKFSIGGCEDGQLWLNVSKNGFWDFLKDPTFQVFNQFYGNHSIDVNQSLIHLGNVPLQ